MNRILIIGISVFLFIALGIGLFFHYWSKDDRRPRPASVVTIAETPPPLPAAPPPVPLEEPVVPETGSETGEGLEHRRPSPDAPTSPASMPASEAGTAAELVAQLGADHFQIRRKAEQDLIKLGAAALPELHSAANSVDPELRIRASRLRRQILFNRLMTDSSPRDAMVSGKFNAANTPDQEPAPAQQPELVQAEYPVELLFEAYNPQDGSFTGEIRWTDRTLTHPIHGTATMDMIIFEESRGVEQEDASPVNVYVFDLIKSPNLEFSDALHGAWTHLDSANMVARPNPRRGRLQSRQLPTQTSNQPGGTVILQIEPKPEGRTP